MQPKRSKLLILCTDLAAVRGITDAAGRHFDLACVRDLNGLSVALRGDPVPVAVLIDNAAISVSAIEALESVRRARPGSRRILITDYCDLGIIVQGLHTGAIQHIAYKPIHTPELLGAIGAAHLPASAVTPSTSQPPATQKRIVG